MAATFPAGSDDGTDGLGIFFHADGRPGIDNSLL